MIDIVHRSAARNITEQLSGTGKGFVTAVHEYALKTKNRPLVSASELMLHMPDALFISQFGADIARAGSDSHGMPTYPTSNYWQPIQQEAIFSSEKSGNAISLYVHIPFCENFCSYCHYIKAPLKTDNINRYIEALSREISLLSQRAPSTLSSVYIGGGTPSLLPVRAIRQLLDSIQRNFVVTEDTDYTFEVSPVNVQREEGYDKIALLKEFNVNRVSMGVQTFDQDVLKICNRSQTPEQVRDAIETIHKVGIKTTDADLIVGLPQLTLPRIELDVNQLISFGLNEITIHPLGLKSGSKMHSYLESHPDAFPSREVKFLSMVFADAILAENGFVTFLPKHYGKPDSERFIYEKYRRIINSDLLAVGLSSSGYYHGFQYGNTAVFKDYIGALSQNKLPITKGIKVDGDESMRRFIIMSIRTLEGINKDLFLNRFGIFPNEAFKKEFSLLTSLGIIYDENDCIKCTNIGRFFSDFAAYQFISRRD